MKKRLFLSSAIMTAVLAGALTTGTFAWYSAGQSAGAIAGSKVSELTTAKATVSATTDLGVVVSINEVTNTSSLVLAEWYDSDSNSTADAFRTGYYNTATSSPVYVSLGDNQVYSKAYEIKIESINDVSGYTTEQLAQLIKAAQITVSVEVSDKLEDTTTVNSLQSKTHVWCQKASLSDNATPTNTVSYDFLTADFSTWDGSSALTIGYLAFYVDGASTADQGNTALKTAVKVTIAKKTA